MWPTQFNPLVQYRTTIGWVRKLHELAGYKTPDPKESNYKLIIQALRVELAKPVKQAKPMIPELIRKIYDQIDLGDPLEVVCYSAILIGFYLFLRKINLFPDSTVSFDPEKQLTWGDIFAAGWLKMLDIRWSKTI